MRPTSEISTFTIWIVTSLMEQWRLLVDCLQRPNIPTRLPHTAGNARLLRVAIWPYIWSTNVISGQYVCGNERVAGRRRTRPLGFEQTTPVYRPQNWFMHRAVLLRNLLSWWLLTVAAYSLRVLSHSTIAGSRWSKKLLGFSSSPEIAASSF